MMTINKSAAWVSVKYLISMPVLVLTIVLSVLNFNAYAQEEEIFPEPEVAAKYNNGGMEGILPFIMQNIKFPNSAIKNNVSAKIFVQFVIDTQGKVTDVLVIRRDITDATGKEILVKDYKPGTNQNVNPEAVADMEAEALRVVNLLKGFTPAHNDGKNVKTQFTIPIAFALGEGK